MANISSQQIQDDIVDVIAEDIVVDSDSEKPTKTDLDEQPRQRYECNEEFETLDGLTRSQMSSTLDIDRESLISLPYKRPGHRFKTELEPEDVRLVNELGQLSADQLMEYLRKIKDMACGLGQAQEDQCLRGKFMQVFKQ